MTAQIATFSTGNSALKLSVANKSFAPTMTLAMAKQRAKMLIDIRAFFAEREVLEVQTPLLSRSANTDTFLQSVRADVHYQDKPMSYYLHTSPEFAMKRLLASWRSPIFQICPVFRDNEIGRRHNIEFTMLEWYRPDFSLSQLAEELRLLLEAVSKRPVVLNHYRYIDAFLDFVGIHPLTASIEALQAVAEDKGVASVDFSGMDSEDIRQGWLDLLFSHLVEPNLGHELPTLIIDYPKATAALAKTAIDKDGNEVARRFELYINGIEIANAYDELADSALLRSRFEADNARRRYHGLPIMPIDEHLLAASENLPNCSGIAVGFDRLLMVITGATSLSEVIPFPSDLA
ncbi:EF-P lysine aminoacylase EpmA [Psychrobacter ciconiae]|uniref:EF-P lysine aminoacylase EpmA n=1 Tax=Psychrobacter ciconiae TaxID=1553449 RepID=UPI001917E085|nr:EF-P lysine aminoacylase EpmA [Psychrobacter ciconiae]